MGAQVLEVVRLTKERREVGGDGIAEIHQLPPAIPAHQVAILAKGPEVQGAQPASKPSVNQLPFLLREVDASVFLDELAQRLKVLFREHEFAHPQRR